MPRTIKLSKQFYDRFGDQVADEMIDLFNSVDDSYRSSLKEQNESNFSRFAAELKQQFAEADAKMERRFAEVDVKMEKRFGEMDVKFANLEVRVERALKDQTRWMFFAWSTLFLAIIGLWVRR